MFDSFGPWGHSKSIMSRSRSSNVDSSNLSFFVPSTSSLPARIVSIIIIIGNFCDKGTFAESNVMYERSHWDQTDGKGFSIFYPNIAMAYGRLKHIMRLKFRQSHFVPHAYLYSEDFYNVAWHVSVGHITLHADNSVMFENIAAQVGKYADVGGSHRPFFSWDRPLMWWVYCLFPPFDYPFARPCLQVGKLLEGFKVRKHVFAEDPGSGTNPPRGFGLGFDQRRVHLCQRHGSAQHAVPLCQCGHGH